MASPKMSPRSEHHERLVFARTTIGITMRSPGSCKVESTVYGAALVMPQMARSSGWDKTLTIMAFRSICFLIVNVVLQAAILKFLSKELNVMNRFSGQMELCDFGASLADCTAGTGHDCKGPFGTDITAPRLYSWDQLMIRQFTRDSLKAIFPDMAGEIGEKVDPGEYGLESYGCRLVCCFVFIISAVSDLEVSTKIVRLLYHVPTEAESWIALRQDQEPDDPPATGSLDDVHFRIAGMPLIWKIFNTLCVVIPKFMLWKQLVETGILFLMETTDITDQVMNSVALGLITQIDEMVFATCMSEEVQRIVYLCADHNLYDEHSSCVGDMSILTDEELLEKHQETQAFRSWGFMDTVSLFPPKLVVSILLTAAFIYEYYSDRCVQIKGSHWVSQAMYLPKSVLVSWGYAFFPAVFPMEMESEPYWQMPGE